jgi:RNA polymerase sigma factor (sigma-70 family)
MAQGQYTGLVRHIRRLVGAPADEQQSDGALLERFVRLRDEAAFAALLRRHGPMVLGVCRRVLEHEQDAEDAFQAAFLVLARKAGSIRRLDSVAGWLCRVAYHLAVAARARVARRRALERQAGEMARAASRSDAAGRNLRLLLDEELNHLPRKYHAPLVLCYLEGKTHEEAARELRWPVGTVKGRLARAREMLRLRLLHRGFLVPAGLAGTLFVEETAAAAVPAALNHATLRAVILCAAGEAAAGVVSADVAALVEGVTRAMFMTKLRIVATVLLAMGLLGTGVGLVTHRVLAAGPQPTAEAPARLEAAPASLPARMVDDGDKLDPRQTETVLKNHSGAVLTVAVSPDGVRLASGSADKTVRVWDMASKKEVVRLEGHTEAVTSVAFSPDARRLASGSADKTVKLWDPATGKELASLRGHTDAVTSVAFSPDGKTLASGGKDQTVRFWDVASGREIRQIHGRAAITALVLAPDGRTAATGGADGNVSLWDLATGKLLATAMVHKGEVTSLATSPDGKNVAAASADKTVKLLEWRTGKVLSAFEGHGGAVRAVGISPDGKHLATAGDGKNVHVFDLASGKDLAVLQGHTEEITSLAFSPDGRTLFTGSTDKTVRVWDLAK